MGAANDILDHLQARRFAPPEWAMAREVTIRGRAGDRRLDAVAVNVWDSRGHTLVGFEEKASRADWLRERSNPEKADLAMASVDRFYLVASAGVANEDEVPASWGFLELRGSRWYTRRAAPQLVRDPTARVRLLVGVLKALRRADEALLAEARQEGYEAGYKAGRSAAALVDRSGQEAVLREQVESLRKSAAALRAYEETLGAEILKRWATEGTEPHARRVGRIVRFLLGSGRSVAEQWASSFERVASGAQELRQLVLEAAEPPGVGSVEGRDQ